MEMSIREIKKQAKTFNEIHEWIANALPNHREMRSRKATSWVPRDAVEALETQLREAKSQINRWIPQGCQGYIEQVFSEILGDGDKP